MAVDKYNFSDLDGGKFEAYVNTYMALAVKDLNHPEKPDDADRKIILTLTFGKNDDGRIYVKSKLSARFPSAIPDIEVRTIGSFRVDNGQLVMFNDDELDYSNVVTHKKFAGQK